MTGPGEGRRSAMAEGAEEGAKQRRRLASGGAWARDGGRCQRWGDRLEGGMALRLWTRWRLRPRDFRRRGTGQRAGPRRGREGEGRRKAAVLVGAGRRSKRRRGGGRVWGSHGGGGEGIGRRELLSLARCERVSGDASRGTRERGFEREGG